VTLRGQVTTMTQAYSQLLTGLGFAIILIYLLIVVNFQSWLDPAVIVLGLPGALAGIVWILFITGTTISVPALTGAIMCMGVATANSILVVSFARERMESGMSALRAAMEAGATRFRPVLMTALAMIIGMGPTALSAEQNAPLGRAANGKSPCPPTHSPRSDRACRMMVPCNTMRRRRTRTTTARTTARRGRAV
jgi:multidrug efflux pump subunit AcrB